MEKDRVILLSLEKDVQPTLERISGLFFAEESIDFSIVHDLRFVEILSNIYPSLIVLLLAKDFSDQAKDRLYSLAKNRPLLPLVFIPLTETSKELSIDFHFNHVMNLPLSKSDLKQIKFLFDKQRVNLNDTVEKMLKTYQIKNIIGNDPKYCQLLLKAQRVSKCDASLLIRGERGSGKKTLAYTIHKMSNRSDRTFFHLKCETLACERVGEGLFGLANGSLSNKYRSNRELIKKLIGGTLYIENIDELTLFQQIKLLKFLENLDRIDLQNNKFNVNLRLITSTCSDLRQKIYCGEFRSDLYYKLSVTYLILPSLRERKNDIPLLANHFLSQRDKNRCLDSKVSSMLKDYDWPGNLHELKSIINTIYNRSKNQIIKLSDFESLVDAEQHPVLV